MQYAPTRDNKKRKMNNEKIGYPAKFSGLGEALIFFSHPFLVSRQEKDVGVRGQRPLPPCYMCRTVKIWPFPSSCTRPYWVVLWGVCDTPLPGTTKNGERTTKKLGTQPNWPASLMTLSGTWPNSPASVRAPSGAGKIGRHPRCLDLLFASFSCIKTRKGCRGQGATPPSPDVICAER